MGKFQRENIIYLEQWNEFLSKNITKRKLHGYKESETLAGEPERILLTQARLNMAEVSERRRMKIN